MPAGTYILLDAARMGSAISTAMELEPRHKCLYSGKTAQELWAVAPYLFHFNSEGELGDWFRENGWGNSWGVLIKTVVPFDDLVRHCRKFIVVNTESGKELYFRFYDPRVIRIFLPTCSAQQLNDFFGPISSFIAEDEDHAFALNFTFNHHKLNTARIDLENVFDTTPSKNSITESKVLAEEKPAPTRAQSNENNDKNAKGKGWNTFFFDK